MSININKNQFQAHPYHMVDPSPWPISLSFALLILTISAVMYMQGFNYGGYLLNLGFILTATGMALWFRDVIVEGKELFTTKFLLSSHTVKNTPRSEQLKQDLIKFYK